MRAQCVGRGGRCRLHAAPHLRSFPVRLHAGYSAVRVVGWCGKFDGVGTVDMGVRGVGRGGWVPVQCVGLGVRVRLHAAPHLCGFPVQMHAGYSAVCVAGWCGKWGCVGTVDMGVRGWGVLAGCVRSVLGMVRP